MRNDRVDFDGGEWGRYESSDPFYDDPLGRDRPGDQSVLTTRRALCRLVTAAAQVGGTFARQSVRHDPVAWMLAPRVAFDGAAAIDACLTRQGLLRSLVLHGAGLGLDADPDLLDALASDDDETVRRDRKAA